MAYITVRQNSNCYLPVGIFMPIPWKYQKDKKVTWSVFHIKEYPLSDHLHYMQFFIFHTKYGNVVAVMSLKLLGIKITFEWRSQNFLQAKTGLFWGK